MKVCFAGLAANARLRSTARLISTANQKIKVESVSPNPGIRKMAEGRGFEPPVGLLLRLISSQVPLTTQPPFRSNQPGF